VHDWRVSSDSKTGRFTHTVPEGFGHGLLSPIAQFTFWLLRVSASVWDGRNWFAIHKEPDVLGFELEHGVEAQRWAYNDQKFAQVLAHRRPVGGEHAGLSDVFVPILRRGHVVGVLVVGPFATAWPTSADILQRWRRITGRQGHPSDPEFATYLSATLAILVLDGGRARGLEQLAVCMAGLMSGEGRADELMNQADALRVELESARLVERTWDAVAEMVDERSAHKWQSAHSAYALGTLGMSEIADHVLVGLTVNATARPDPVEEALRRNALQRASVELGRATGNAIAGRVGDHGVVLLSASHGPARKKRQKALDLAERVAGVALRRFGLSLRVGISATDLSAPISRSYQAALDAAEAALTEGAKLVTAEAGPRRRTRRLGELRKGLAVDVEERPEVLAARFERYLEAVALRCGYRMDAARGHLEAGYERLTERLVESGALEQKGFMASSHALDRAAADARTLADLFAAYRRAVADVAAAAAQPTAARRDRSLRAAVEYVQQHYAEPLPLENVAHVAGFAPTHFSRLFQRREGMTFADYVRTLRLERAKQLLTSTELDVTRVADLSGFRSAQYFCRAFRRATGKTPLDFRRLPSTIKKV
jgi:AraC-like DNA-binding protein